MEGSAVDAGRRALRRAARRAVGRGRVAAAVASTIPRRTDARRLDAADVALVQAGPGERDVLANLIQLYRHDMSEFRGYELSESGTYEYGHLDDYVGGPDREAWLIHACGRLAGFVLTRRLPEGTWQVSEHFVARSWRGRGLGRLALAKAFATHDGRWTCFVDEANGTSARACTGAVADVGAEDPRTTRGLSSKGFVGTVYRFAVPARGDTAEPEGPGAVTCC